MNRNSLAGLKPKFSPTPIINGLIYKVAPVPLSGTKSLFALTVSITACSKVSIETGGITNLLADS